MIELIRFEVINFALTAGRRFNYISNCYLLRDEHL